MYICVTLFVVSFLYFAELVEYKLVDFSANINIFLSCVFFLVSFITFFWKLSRCFVNSVSLIISVSSFSKICISLHIGGHFFISG